MFGRILLWIAFMAGGCAMMYRSYPLVENLGKSARAEEHLGGTRNLLLMIGFGLIVVWWLVMTGVISIGSPADNLMQSLENS